MILLDITIESQDFIVTYSLKFLTNIFKGSFYLCRKNFAEENFAHCLINFSSEFSFVIYLYVCNQNSLKNKQINKIHLLHCLIYYFICHKYLPYTDNLLLPY